MSCTVPLARGRAGLTGVPLCVTAVDEICCTLVAEKQPLTRCKGSAASSEVKEDDAASPLVCDCAISGCVGKDCNEEECPGPNCTGKACTKSLGGTGPPNCPTFCLSSKDVTAAVVLGLITCEMSVAA